MSNATDQPTDDIETDSDDVEVLPWWRNPVNLVVLLVTVVLLAAAGGYVVGHNRALPDPNATDTGFLQDMRFHHEQAVQLSFIYLDRPDTDPNLTTIARDIVVSQEQEIGIMIQLLRNFGESAINETDVAMAWMNDAVPLDEMPGLATPDQITALTRASGTEADALFARLMTTHHEGGIHMADHAASHANTDEVRTMATKMAAGQRDEVAEMARLAPTGG
ncbi:MAG: DUF305 domain-containing protein [Ilumatobacteraceae bacterium]